LAKIARLEFAGWSPTPDQQPGQSCEDFDLRLTSVRFSLQECAVTQS
jgi:hypothetical protein